MEVIMTMPSVSIITTCKGRLTHLRQTFPLMLALDYEGPLEVIVVDYGCPDGAADYVESEGHARGRAVRVTKHTEWWNMSRARNLGANAATGEYLAFVDADYLLQPTYIARAVGAMTATASRLGCPSLPHCELFGACVVEARWIHHLRGFDEALNENGYGWDDIDFYHRSTAHGEAPLPLGTGLLEDIKHGDDDRTRFYSQKDIRAGHQANIALARDTLRAVNPHGYGRDE